MNQVRFNGTCVILDAQRYDDATNELVDTRYVLGNDGHWREFNGYDVLSGTDFVVEATK